MEIEEMKVWPCYSGREDWYNCSLVLENGYIPYGHVCSHPNFAPGDLLLGRPERIAVFEAMNIKYIMQPICRDVDVPSEVLERYKNSESYAEFGQKFRETQKRLEETAEK